MASSRERRRSELLTALGLSESDKDNAALEWDLFQQTGGGATPGAHTHTIGYDDLPASLMLSVYWSGSAWPARPTTRTDITVQWIGGTSTVSPPGEPGVDIWVRDAGV